MRWAAVLLLALGSGCQGGSSHLLELYGGPANLDIVQYPDRVEAFRIRPPRTKAEARQPGEYNHWPILAGPVTPDEKTRAALGAALVDERTYCDWDGTKGCIPTPGLMLRQYRDARRIDLTFCFECDMLFCHEGERLIHGANFDTSHNTLLRLFMRVFPSDPDFPKLIRRD